MAGWKQVTGEYLLFTRNLSKESSFNLHFVGVGPQRTGTSWLDKILRHHPQLSLPRDVKETRFFEKYYQKGPPWYMAHFFQRRSDSYFGEICPTYFDIDEAPRRISDFNPECRIIITLRDPISRTFSLYRHHLLRGHFNGSFEDLAANDPRFLDSGRYAQHVPKWLERFGKNQVLYILFDEIVFHPDMVMKRLCNFLEIKNMALPEFGTQKAGVVSMPRFRWLAKIAVKATNWLRGNRLHRLVELGKALGLNDIVLGGGSGEIPAFTEDEKSRILKEFEPDIIFVEELLGCDLTKWRQGA